MADPQPQQPETRSGTRVWLITSAFSALGYAVAQEALKLGDYVAAGCKRGEIAEHGEKHEGRSIEALKKLGGNSCMVVELDTRKIALCQSALAEAVHAWGRIDVVLNCDSSTYAGTLEELQPMQILAQFEKTYFGPVNMMKCALPYMRKQRGGHLVNVTGLTGHMGTPGLGARCASDHALEGFSDSLAYEIAPFNVKLTIVQPPMEVGVLSSPLHFQESELPAYNGSSHPFSGVAALLNSAPQSTGVLAESVSIILHIAGLENPPGRIVVGNEGVEMVKDRVKTVSEELEEFLDASLGADIPKE